MDLGYQPQAILSGREVNERMGVFVAEKMTSLLAVARKGEIKGAKVLILGFSFKENCPDTRNTKVLDIINQLESAGINTSVYDPHVNAGAVAAEFGVRFADTIPESLDGLIIAVATKNSGK